MQIVERLQCSSNTASGHNANSPWEGRADLPTIFCQFSVSTVDENLSIAFLFYLFIFFLKSFLLPFVLSFVVDSCSSCMVHASRRSFDLNRSRAKATSG